MRYSEHRAYTINELASVINRKPKELEQALKMLINKELLEVWEDGTIYIYDVNVGSITGQTLRKNKGKQVVEITEELPKNYRNNVVKITPEIRDKSIENTYIDDVSKRFKSKWVEAGYDEQLVDTALNVCKQNLTEENLQKVMGILTNSDIANPIGYIQTLKQKGAL